MKKLISFLCRMPGIFLMTLIFLSASVAFHWTQLDERLPVTIIMALIATPVVNFYLFFLQADKTGELIKGSKWIPIILIGALTIVCIMGNISIKSENSVESLDDYALQSVLWESFGGVLVWAWFALMWNIRNSQDFAGKTLPHTRETNEELTLKTNDL